MPQITLQSVDTAMKNAAAAAATSAAAAVAISGGAEGLEAAKDAFLQAHGKEYGYNRDFDKFWAEELGERVGERQHYLDFTGSSVYAKTQLQNVFKVRVKGVAVLARNLSPSQPPPPPLRSSGVPHRLARGMGVTLTSLWWQ